MDMENKRVVNMEKLKVCYKECALGELSVVEQKYVYIPNEKGITEARKKKYPIFLYNTEDPFVSDVLPDPWQRLIITNEPENKMIAFDIDENDDDFVRLCKVAEVDCHRPDFHFETF